MLETRMPASIDIEAGPIEAVSHLPRRIMKPFS
jgi:hypothetical protein